MPKNADEVDPRAPSSVLSAMQRELVSLRGEVARLANLYVSSYRLHDARSRREVLQVVEEIVISLVGSEEFGIFELDPESAELVPASVFNLDASTIAWVGRAEGPVAACLVDGRLRVGPSTGTPGGGEPGARLTALVPLARDGRVVGVVAIFAMLAHKPELASDDIALLELLSAHTSPSLHYAELTARTAPRLPDLERAP